MTSAPRLMTYNDIALINLLSLVIIFLLQCYQRLILKLAFVCFRHADVLFRYADISGKTLL